MSTSNTVLHTTKTTEKNINSTPECSKCEQKALYRSHGQQYCRDHFINYFERKVFKTISKYKLISPDDRVCVAASGGKDSLAVLYMTMKYCRKNKIDFFALCIDEGIASYRDHTVDDLKTFCEQFDIPRYVVSFKVEFGAALDDIREKAMKEHGKKPCTVCGILRRALLNKASRMHKATKLVTGHNLDDESQSFLMNTVLGNMRHNASLGPNTGLQKQKEFVSRVKPLYFITEKETRLFCLLKGFKVNFTECPNIGLSFRAQIRDKLNEIEDLSPGSKNGIVNAFLDVLPDLKDKYKSTKEFTECTRCGEPSSGKVCNVCKLEEELNLTVKKD